MRFLAGRGPERRRAPGTRMREQRSRETLKCLANL